MKKFIAELAGKLFRFKCRLIRKNIIIKDGLKIYKKLKIIGEGKVYIGENCTIDGIIGDDSQYVTIATYSPEAIISIGDNVRLYAARIASKFQITIGDNVLVEESGLLDTDFHAVDRSREVPVNESKENCKISIGNNVCIGAKCIVTKGVTIENDVRVAPSSVVSMSIKQGSVVSGNPAKSLEI